MTVDIIVVYVARYRSGHEAHFVPPITGIHLAALTPPRHTVRVTHQQVEPVNLDTDADVVALTFFSGFAPEAYRLATEFRKRGKTVIAGGPHASFGPEESLRYVDSVVLGEAEDVWATVLDDIEAGCLKPRYHGEPSSMRNLPTPRYDLLPKSFFIRRVIQATRGCPFTCSFCTVPTLNPGYRMRPVTDVVRDVQYDDFRWWWQRKVVWFWDDNLTIRRPYIRELLAALVPLRKWWLTQASMDVARDEPLLDLMRESGCIGIFFGIESFGQESLADAHKPQNKTHEYRERISALHKRGICVMAGFISGLEGDTPQTIRAMARKLYEVGVDVPFLSILTPYRGTASYDRMVASGRMRSEVGWEHYNGYNVAFHPRNMTPEELLAAHRALWYEAFSPYWVFRRVWRGLFTLRFGAFLMSLFMNVFYCWKAVRRNEPVSFEGIDKWAEFREEYADDMHAPSLDDLVQLNTRKKGAGKQI